MKCPQCSEKIGLFSEQMKQIGTDKVCPHCGTGIKVGLQHGKFLIGFGLVAAIALFLGLSSPITAGIAGGVGAVFGLGLIRS